MVCVGGSVDCMSRVGITRYGAWSLSGQPPDHASDRCYVSCALLFVVFWLALVVFCLAVNGVRLLQWQWGECQVWRGVAGVKGLKRVQGWWRCRGCGIGGVGGGAGVRGWRGRRECRRGGGGGGGGGGGVGGGG